MMPPAGLAHEQRGERNRREGRYGTASRWLLVLLLVLIASSAYADKTITQKTVVLPNITRLNVDVVAGVPAAIVTYQVVDSTGTAIGHNKSLTVPLTGPQTTTLVNFLTTVILPAINVAEGT